MADFHPLTFGLWPHVSRPWITGAALVIGFVVEWWVIQRVYRLSFRRSLRASVLANAMPYLYLGFGFGITAALVNLLLPIHMILPRPLQGLGFYIAWWVLLSLASFALEFLTLSLRFKSTLDWGRRGLLLLAKLISVGLLMASVYPPRTSLRFDVYRDTCGPGFLALVVNRVGSVDSE